MFDVGFWELGLIALVALIVIGPERLPKVARTVGMWLGRGRRFVANVKADIDREIKAEELKEILEKQKKMANPVHEILEETQQDLDRIKQDVSTSVQQTEEKPQSQKASKAQISDQAE
ncbi:MAG: Sec-independent protein translocase protein TatB [Candidatus Thiodiazotropha sp.]